MAAAKVTFTLDRELVARLRATAERLAIRRRVVVRQASRALSEVEKLRLLEAFDRLVPTVPPRSLRDVERELSELWRSRRRGDRRSETGHRNR